MKKPCLRTLAVLLVFLFCIGCKSVSVISDSREIDLSAVVPNADNPNNYIDSVRYSPIPTDQGIFHIIREADADYISFQTNQGEEIKLLKGRHFVNMQLVQPYLYFIDINSRTESDGDYAMLYRLNLSDRSLSYYPHYTVRYYALSDGDILRIPQPAKSAKGYYKDTFYNLVQTDWDCKNSWTVSSDTYLYNPLPEGDSVKWLYRSKYRENEYGFVQYAPGQGMVNTCVLQTIDYPYDVNVYLYNNEMYCMKDIYFSYYPKDDNSIYEATVYKVLEDGNLSAMVKTRYRYNKKYKNRYLTILPESTANRIVEALQPEVVIREPLENDLCLFGIISSHEVEIYVYESIVYYYEIDTGVETIISLKSVQ